MVEYSKSKAESILAAAEPHLRKKWAEGVVCLCGSTRFRAEIVEANRLLTLEGHIVLAPGVFGHDGDPITDDEKAKLDALHLRKIDMAEQVIVIAPGGYIGESTRREIVYAESTGKPVIIWNQITLEGAGERTPQRNVPHTGPGHLAGDPAFCEGCLAKLKGAGE